MADTIVTVGMVQAVLAVLVMRVEVTVSMSRMCQSLRSLDIYEILVYPTPAISLQGFLFPERSAI